MPDFNVAKAIRSNPIYARHLRWWRKYAEILDAMGVSDPPRSPVAFAEAVADWQATQPLVRDGMLGPNTWRRLRSRLRTGVARVPLPGWLTPGSATQTEGWSEAVVSTLREDIHFLRLSRGRVQVEPRDFHRIANLIEKGHIEVIATRRRRGASYEPRNEEDDAHTLKLPRRSRGPWRRAQALIVHEVCHAICDLRWQSRIVVEEEAFAFVVQGMYLERHGVPPLDDEHRDLRRAVRTLGRRALDDGEIGPADWLMLEQAIRRDPAYGYDRVDRVLEFDGIPGAEQGD